MDILSNKLYILGPKEFDYEKLIHLRPFDFEISLISTHKLNLAIHQLDKFENARRDGLKMLLATKIPLI
jgi:hypothetical protein